MDPPPFKAAEFPTLNKMEPPRPSVVTSPLAMVTPPLAPLVEAPELKAKEPDAPIATVVAAADAMKTSPLVEL